MRARPYDRAQARQDRRGRQALEARGIRVCRGCGCTEHNACVDEHDWTCSWVDVDRCSTCEAWIRFRFCRDFLRGRGWILGMQLLPAKRLMNHGEEGRMTLAALAVEVRLQPAWPFVQVSAYSDADEIATRLAAEAGWPPLMEPPRTTIRIQIKGFEKLRAALEQAGEQIREATAQAVIFAAAAQRDRRKG